MMEEESTNIQQLPTENDTFVGDSILDTLIIPSIDNPDDREYEKLKKNKKAVNHGKSIL